MLGRPGLVPSVGGAGLAGVVGLLLGGATSGLQTVLPDGLAPLANSAGPWCFAAWLLALSARSVAGGVARAVLTLAGLVVGYYVTAGLRGYAVSTTWVGAWLVVALLAGSVLGIAAVGLRAHRRVVRVAAGLVLPGLLVAESAYGLTVVGGTTPAGYWVAEAVLAVALAVVHVARAGGSRGSAGLGPVTVRCQR